MGDLHTVINFAILLSYAVSFYKGIGALKALGIIGISVNMSLNAYISPTM